MLMLEHVLEVDQRAPKCQMLTQSEFLELLRLIVELARPPAPTYARPRPLTHGAAWQPRVLDSPPSF